MKFSAPEVFVAGTTQSAKVSGNIIIPLAITAVALLVILFAALAVIFTGIMLARRKVGRFCDMGTFASHEINYKPLYSIHHLYFF